MSRIVKIAVVFVSGLLLAACGKRETPEPSLPPVSPVYGSWEGVVPLSRNGSTNYQCRLKVRLLSDVKGDALEVDEVSGDCQGQRYFSASEVRLKIEGRRENEGVVPTGGLPRPEDSSSLLAGDGTASGWISARNGQLYVRTLDVDFAASARGGEMAISRFTFSDGFSENYSIRQPVVLKKVERSSAERWGLQVGNPDLAIATSSSEAKYLVCRASSPNSSMTSGWIDFSRSKLNEGLFDQVEIHSVASGILWASSGYLSADLRKTRIHLSAANQLGKELALQISTRDWSRARITVREDTGRETEGLCYFVSKM